MSILIGYVCVFVLILFLERFSMKTLSVLVWTEGLNASNYVAFSNEKALQLISLLCIHPDF